MKKKIFMTLAVMVSMAAATANAALPAGLTDGITTFTTDWGTLETALWGLFFAVFGGLLYFKLFRKGVNKAT